MEDVVMGAANDSLGPSVPDAQEIMKAKRRSLGGVSSQLARSASEPQLNDVDATAGDLSPRHAGESLACAEDFELAIGDGL
jgi:hypothetical protein